MLHHWNIWAKVIANMSVQLDNINSYFYRLYSKIFIRFIIEYFVSSTPTGQNMFY